MDEVKKNTTGVALKHVSLGKWFMLGGVVFSVAALLIWIFFGRITSILSLRGVVAANRLPVEIYMGEDGYVVHQDRWIGDLIKKGESIMRYVPTADLEKEISGGGGLVHGDIEGLEKDIVSPCDGYVVNTFIKAGDYAQGMYPVAAVAEMQGNRTVLAFVRESELGTIKKGMEVRVRPDMYQSDEYGYMTGHIARIREDYMTREELELYIGADEIMEEIFDDKQENHLVVISLECDENGDPVWTGGTIKDNDADIRFGMVCSLDVVTQTYKPYMYLFR